MKILLPYHTHHNMCLYPESAFPYCRSPKLKPFWLSLQEKDEYVPTLDYLTKALLGSASDTNLSTLESDTEWSAPEYTAAMKRALKIPTCPIVPFFGAYLRELRTVLNTPSLIVLSSGSEQHQLQVSENVLSIWVNLVS